MTEPTEPGGEGTWSKLSRRKVVQWGLAYAAGAWTLLQVIEYLGETYSWPPAIRQIATPALALGSLLVLVLAWYHGDKGEQKVSRTEFAILAVLAVAVGGTMWWYASRLDQSAWLVDTGVPNTGHALPADAASIAVLPFVDMSPGKDQEYFADGMSEEVLNLLAQLPQLRVDCAHIVILVQGQGGGHRDDREDAECRARARRQRAQVGRHGADHGAAHPSVGQHAPVVADLRPPAHRRVQGAGRDRAGPWLRRCR